MPFAIRTYLDSDLQACRGLWEELTERHRQIYEDPTIGGDHVGLYFDRHLARVGAENLFLAAEDGVVVGMTGLILGEDEAEVEPVVVSAPRRGRGIGSQLLGAAIERARSLGLRHLNIGPVARNSRALELFIRSGFGLIGHVNLFMELKPDGRAPPRSPEETAQLTDLLARWS
ncbi:MAG TPA: GNAT family N-acetyltransferase [Caulobacteraceae bacterium]|nr:GNAT family N-acetyltransferase [Caulobacteraceae bacterium]